MIPDWLSEAIKQGGLFGTTIFGLTWALMERRDRMREREANAAALKAAQDQAVTVATVVTKIEGTLARFIEALEQMKHRLEDLAP